MNDLREQLKVLGFSVCMEDPSKLASSTDYKIYIVINEGDFSKSKIEYGNEIIVHNLSTSNLRKEEHLVTLECVIRLLDKGYLPDKIELEKTWPSGHGTSGRLDILLRSLDSEVYAMIECKTWGEEYAKERDKMLEDGGQLFSYLVQEQSTKTLILYSSSFEDEIKYRAEAINSKALNGSNIEELFQSWDKSFILKGIFDKTVQPYHSQKRNLFKGDLKELDIGTGQGLFNSFAEILRRHVVSDKSNAFNKIFNLFVCKIYDEDTNSIGDELDFQWKVNDTLEKLIGRLSNLYMRGLSDYLLIDTNKEYFSPYSEFAFIDIYNKESYTENFTIVKEVVELLQYFQIKYSSKHQFLGDFFERLLNTGIKQEAGQFFTPIPLARFFVKSIPIEKIIENNIRNKNTDVFPFVIDYACGSGHFLTEAIDEIEEHIGRIDSNRLVGRIKKRFIGIKDNYFWAKEYIYGIEKDYRLAKTTKIALFMNGDGDAKIINGDGLDDFYESISFVGLLKSNQSRVYNSKFNIVVSNPPFSISGFKQYLANGDENFSLYEFLTSKSSEIECLFVERLNHLLNEEGYGGIILPLSILNNKNAIYTETRKKILIQFELIGLVELRDKTFSATNTTTVGLFLRKRTQKQIHDALISLHEHFVEGKTNAEITKVLHECIESNSRLGTVAPEDISALLRDSNLFSGDLQTRPIDTSILDDKLAILLICYLCKNQSTVIAFSGGKKEQEEFLGYRFSKSRGKEGIEFLTENGKLKSKLYDETNIWSNNKVNAHIRANFLGEIIEIPQDLENNLKYIGTSKLLKNHLYVLDNPSKYFDTGSYIIESNSPLGDFIDDFEHETHRFPVLVDNEKISYISGLTYEKKDEVPQKTSKKVLTASNLNLKTGKLVFDKKIYLREDFNIPELLKPKVGDIIISNSSGSLKHLGKCVYIRDSIDWAVGGFLSIIRPNDIKLGKAIFYRLLSLSFRKYVASLKDQNINNIQFSELNNFHLQLPKDLDSFYSIALEKEHKIEELELQISNIRNNYQ